MTDIQQADINSVKDTQNAPMPSANQQTSAPEITPEAAHTEVPSSEQSGTTLPDNASERTKSEFEKLRSQLREERARREYAESVFQSLQTPKREEPKAESVLPITDPDTGLLNEQALTDIQKRSLQAEERARRAEAAIAQFQADQRKAAEEQENNAAYRAHPELNPNDKNTFKKELHVAARRLILDSMLNPQDYGNRQLSLKEAGDILKGNQASQGQQIDGASQMAEDVTPKEQASMEATGNAQRRGELDDDIETLRVATRHGDKGAIAARWKKMFGENN